MSTTEGSERPEFDSKKEVLQVVRQQVAESSDILGMYLKIDMLPDRSAEAQVKQLCDLVETELNRLLDELPRSQQWVTIQIEDLIERVRDVYESNDVTPQALREIFELEDDPLGVLNAIIDEIDITLGQD